MGRNKAHSNRQRKQVNWIAKRYPNAWRMADGIRSDPQRRDWPAWCYLPMLYWWKIASQHWDTPEATVERVVGVARLAALGAWRVTQGIYRFDSDLYSALIDTPMTEDLADDLLFRLPAWGVYLETPGLTFSGYPIIGTYAHLEHRTENQQPELRLLLDSNHGDLNLLPVPLRLGYGSLLASATATHDVAWNRVLSTYPEKIASFEDIDPSQDARDLAPILALLLYLCAEEADYERPPRPRLVKTAKQGRVMRIPEEVSYWEVGSRIGAALRKMRAAHECAPEATGDSMQTRARPRPHWRRAHWHSFWTGPLDGERVLRLKWLPPIPIGVDEKQPVVVHRVTTG